MKRTHCCGDLRATHAGQQVVLQGWVSRIREFPETSFVVLRDRTGTTQITVESGNPAFETVAGVRSEFVLEVEGTVRLRDEKNRSTQYATGEIEVIPSKVTVLSSSKPLPFAVDGSPVTAGEELRLQYRYLDLRREPLREALKLRHKVMAAIYEKLDEEEFISVETPLLTKSTPEGARDFLVPSRMNKGSFYALPQSPQLFKQLLMVANFDKYFQIARCFRDEDLRADRQLDFTQLDIEMSFVDMDDVIALNERLIQHVFKKTLDVDVPIPFARLSYTDAMNRFGSDKPDQRFALEFVDVGSAFQKTTFGVFQNALAAKGGCIKALVLPGDLARKQLESLEATAKQHGAKGLAWTKCTPNGLEGGIAKFFSPTELEALGAVTQVQSGQTLVFAADVWGVATKALGAVRLAARELLDLPYSGRFHFSWVVDFPLLEWDEDNNRWTFMHHPFTSPRLKDISKFGTSEMESMQAQAYDLVLNGYEIAGGSIRIHQHHVQEQMFKAIGFEPEEAKRRFGFFLEALQYGTPPHGGIAWGLDRVCAVMAGADSIRDVIAFPKNNRGLDPMSEAPSPVDDKQLLELGVALRKA